MFVIKQKLKIMKERLKDWNKNIFRNVDLRMWKLDEKEKKSPLKHGSDQEKSESYRRYVASNVCQRKLVTSKIKIKMGQRRRYKF